jgi:dTDP-3-amino-3,4,6-trideoxy-alpha-D-glucose transaminase
MPVHLYGQPCALERFRKMRLTLIQDACQAHGIRGLARFSGYVCYSFYPTKNLGCLGDGGAIVTNRASVNKRLRLWRDGGRQGGQVSHFAGVNSRLDEMQSCYLRAFLPRLGEWNARRARLAAIYDEELGGCAGVRLLKRSPESVHHLYVIRAGRRDRLKEYLAAKGIGTAIHYPVPLHLHGAFAGARQKKGSLPHAERACREILSLPLGPYLSDSSAREVAECVRSFYA